ncbi:MAG: Na+/H+ antiporter subunit B [Rhodomicrobium sp.]|nr:Na+/H+ antiporter subunit B [Rhodomicrobium sp.]
MNSLILNAAARIIAITMVAFSLFMLIRGHNEPGGGFIGGLIAATGLTLYAISFGTDRARRLLRIEPRLIAVAGLAVSIVAGALAIVSEAEFLTGQWLFIGGDETSKGLPISSVLLFDIGVYLVVVGATLTIVFALEDEVERWK